MKKKLMLGALALSATAVFGLTGCDKSEEPTNPPETPKYTVTFDHDNNPDTTNTVVEFEQGETELSNVPAVPEMNGFAGVWDTYQLNDESITVTAKYGNGTAQNPYLVATAQQFLNILEDYTASEVTTYYVGDNGSSLDGSGNPVVEADALVKHTVFETADGRELIRLTYNKDDEKGFNVKPVVTTTAESHFKLVNDIDLTTVSTTLQAGRVGGQYFTGVIDGDGKYLRGLDGTLLVDNQGAIFDTVYSATIKNLNVCLGSHIGSLVRVARGGENVFENITVTNTNAAPTTVTQDDNNEAPFINFVMEYANVAFKDCTSVADFISYSSNNGMFVGGYAAKTATVSFENCVVSGDIVSRGKVGMFFGNNSHKPTYTIENCQFNGTVTSIAGSNILVPDIAGTNAFGDEIDNYNTNITGVLTGLTANSLKALTSKYNANIDANTITVADNGNVLDAGAYQLVLSAYAHGSDGSTILTNIVVDGVMNSDNKSVLFANSYYGMMDLATYNTTYGKDIASNDVSVQWKLIDGYSTIKYFVDTTNGVYVIDYSGYDGELTTTINLTNAQLQKTIVFTGSNTIEFIVNFN